MGNRRRIQQPWTRSISSILKQVNSDKLLSIVDPESTVDPDFIDAWIDVPDIMKIVIEKLNVFPFRYRVGDPNATQLFKLLFFSSFGDRQQLRNPLIATDEYLLPRAIFSPAAPNPESIPDEWYEGTFELRTRTSIENQNKYHDEYIAAAIIIQPEYEDSISPLEIPLELDSL